MNHVIQYLSQNNIDFKLHEHPAVYTCEEAELYCGAIPGLSCKNLFLVDKKSQRYFLVIVPAYLKTDLKKLSALSGVARLSFASSDILQEKLGVQPGSVSPFGLINPESNNVEVYIHTEVYNADIVSFHPNRNTASLELTRDMFRAYLDSIEHTVSVIEF